MALDTMSRLVLSLALGSLLLLAGCANHPHRNPPGEFTTQLSEKGEKLFVFTVELPSPAHGHRDNRDTPPPASRGETPGVSPMAHGRVAATMKEMMQGQVYELLHAHLDKSGYCPGGYGVSESQFGPVSTIHGYCIEPRG